MKKGFNALKDSSEKVVKYCKYFIVPGIWIYADKNKKPSKCWAAFTPDKKMIGCNADFLSAKERIKIHKIQLLMTR